MTAAILVIVVACAIFWLVFFGTGNLWRPHREFSSKNREFSRQNREFDLGPIF
jgi:hypothetical protein